jgi:PAS domain S-box-containing protein
MKRIRELLHRFFSVRFKVKSEINTNKGEGFIESSNIYFNLFKNSTVGLYQTTPDGKILSVNPAILKMLNYDSVEDVLKRDLTRGSYVDQKRRDEFIEILEEKGEITDFESRWYTKQGVIIYVKEGAFAVKDINGKIIRYDGTVENITQLKKTQEELITAKEKAEESDRLKSAFLANMSHEIRTPMNGILGFAELLKKPKLSGNQQKQYLEIIEKSGRRMLNIINDLISISKVESGQMEVYLTSTNINEQLDFLQNFFEPEARQKNITLHKHTSLASNKATISTDREKLYAILTNLIKNSIKYTESGKIDFGYTVENSRIEFFVCDTGIGIPKEKRKLVFERFMRADIGLSSRFEGAGLGLSISKAYVEMLGGNIWLDNNIENGTCFRFTLPMDNISIMSDGKDNIKDTITIDSISLPHTKILVADDDDISLHYLATVLSSYNYEVCTAENGKEAVERCRNVKEICLVLMDIKMPVMNGVEATKEIKKFRPELPVVAQTSFALESEKAKYSNLFDDYITKPIMASELKRVINNYLRKPNAKL